MPYVLKTIPGQSMPVIYIVGDAEAFEYQYSKLPCPDDNRNAWIYELGKACAHVNISQEYATRMIHSRLNRRKDPNEVPREVSRAYASVLSWRTGEAVETTGVRMPDKADVNFDPELLRSEAGKLSFDVTSDWIKKRSPVDVDITPAKFLSLVFPGEVSLTTTNMRSKGGFVFESPEESEELNKFVAYNKEGSWFLANPIDNVWRDGSIRSEANLTSFRHAVLESDEADPKQWLAMIVQRTDLRIKSIVWSGRRSIHVLVDIGARNKKEFSEAKSRLMATFCPLGADSGALSSVRLTRLPNVVRKDLGKSQTLLYLNPSPTIQPIVDRPENTKGSR